MTFWYYLWRQKRSERRKSNFSDFRRSFQRSDFRRSDLLTFDVMIKLMRLSTFWPFDVLIFDVPTPSRHILLWFIFNVIFLIIVNSVSVIQLLVSYFNRSDWGTCERESRSDSCSADNQPWKSSSHGIQQTLQIPRHHNSTEKGKINTNTSCAVLSFNMFVTYLAEIKKIWLNSRTNKTCLGRFQDYGRRKR